jgi:hypothetical protein
MVPADDGSEVPAFAEAAARMSAFLRDRGLPGRVVWLSSGNVAAWGRRIWVRMDHADDSSSAAAEVFEAGRRRGLGVTILADCRTEEVTVCRVWAPKDETAAEYAMQGRGLKLSIRTPLLRARAVRSSLFWWLVRRWNSGTVPGDF